MWIPFVPGEIIVYMYMFTFRFVACPHTVAAAHEASEHSGVYRRRKALGAIGILADHCLPQLWIAVRLSESAYRDLDGAVPHRRDDGPWPDAPARRDTRIEGGGTEAGHRPSRLQEQKCLVEERSDRLHR